MASLQLEDHVLRIAEHQSLLFDYLNERSGSWSWSVDLAKGRLDFMDDNTGRTLFTCPTFLLGTKADGDNSFLWGWASPSITQRAAITKRWDALRAQAKREGASEFMQEGALPLEGEADSLTLATVAAGAMGSYTYYAGAYSGGVAFLAVDAPVSQTADALRKVSILTQTISGLEFEHRTATLAYLGQPVETSGNMLTFDVNGAKLAITFDGPDRIADMQVVVGPGSVSSRS